MKHEEDKYHGEYQRVLRRHNSLDPENPDELQNFIDDLREFIKGKVQRTRSVYYANKNLEKHKKYLQLIMKDKMSHKDRERLIYISLLEGKKIDPLVEHEPYTPSINVAISAMSYIEWYLNGITKEYGSDPVLQEKLNSIWKYILPSPMLESAGGSEVK